MKSTAVAAMVLLSVFTSSTKYRRACAMHPASVTPRAHSALCPP